MDGACQDGRGHAYAYTLVSEVGQLLSRKVLKHFKLEQRVFYGGVLAISSLQNTSGVYLFDPEISDTSLSFG